jgi:hypothetical protein
VRGVDGGLLTTLNVLASQQAKSIENTMKLTKQFLDYMATQEEAILTHCASDMFFAIHSNALYLSKAKARSRTGGNMFMAGRDKPHN